MFNINDIHSDLSGKRFLCYCYCASEQEAKHLGASFSTSIRDKYILAELYSKGSTLILDTPSLEMTKSLAILLNNSIT